MLKLINKILFIITIVSLTLLTTFTIINIFPSKSYETVANRWFTYYKVTPPKDYKSFEFREPGFDLLSEREFDPKKNEYFYWITNSGDLITITNQNFYSINTTLKFSVGVDPCGNSRKIIVSTQTIPAEIRTEKSTKKEIKIPLNLNSNSSIFLSVSSGDSKVCQLNNGDDRTFLAKISNVSFENNDKSSK